MPEELTDAEIDKMLERFDQTDPKLQRRIIARFIMQAARATDLQCALNRAPNSDELDMGGLVIRYEAWYAGCVSQGFIVPEVKEPAEPAPRREAVKVQTVLCRHCNKKVALAGDEHGRCSECLNMVPTRRGGWRQLGVYDG